MTGVLVRRDDQGTADIAVPAIHGPSSDENPWEEAMKGIPELLAEARERRVPLAVASSSPRSWVEPHLDRLGLRHGFDTIVTRDDTPRAKPHPDLYEEAVRRLGVPARGAIAFEDSLNGVTAAKAAGLVCVAVPCAMTRDMDFAAADLELSRVDELSLEALLERTGAAG